MITNDQKVELYNRIATKCKEKDCKLLYATISGSHSYKTNTELSDIDAKFVYAAPNKFYLGFNQSEDTLQVEGQDVTGMELRKFVKLAAANNPNVLELLFTDYEFVLFHTSYFKPFLEYRHSFLSKQIFYTYYKYAEGQLKKAKTCTREVIETLEWYENILTSYDLGFPDLQVKQVVRDQFIKVSDKEVEYLNNVPIGSDINYAENGFYKIGVVIDSYFKFKKERWPYSDLGKKRREHVKRYNSDTKNLAHMIRLMETCCEILHTGELLVKRPNAQYLLDIKNGKYSVEELEQEFNTFTYLCNSKMLNCTLPEKPDYEYIENMVVKTLKNIISCYGQD